MGLGCQLVQGLTREQFFGREQLSGGHCRIICGRKPVWMNSSGYDPTSMALVHSPVEQVGW